jgi:hypothetical protein
MSSGTLVLGGVVVGAFAAFVLNGVMHAPKEAVAPPMVMVATQSAPRPSSASPECAWVQKTAGQLSAWTMDCLSPHGQWTVTQTRSPDGFVLQVGTQTGPVVARVFALPSGTPITGWATALQKDAQIPAGCMFVAGSAANTFELVPTGALKAEFERINAYEVPVPPCGPFGMDADSRRVFVMDPSAPDRLIYVDQGQDMEMVQASSVRIVR